MMVVLVSTSDPGLTIFPTHRTAAEFDASNSLLLADGNDPRAALESLPPDRPAAVVYTRDRVAVAEGEPGQLDTQLVETARARRRLHGVRRRGDRRGRRGSRRGGVPASPDEDRGRLRGREARRGAAAEDDVLLSQAAERPPLPPAVTDWLATCRAAVADVQGVLVDLPTRVEREPVVGTGEGGDETTTVDAEVERVVIALLDEQARRLHARLGGDRRGRQGERPAVARARPRSTAPSTRSAASRTSASRWPSQTGRRWTT